jgi:hypothetical protein
MQGIYPATRMCISFFNNIFFSWFDSSGRPRPPHCWDFDITFRHTHTHTHTVRLLWTSDRPIAETSASQHTTFTSDWYPCFQGYSNPPIPASQPSQTHALNIAANVIDDCHLHQRNTCIFFNLYSICGGELWLGATNHRQRNTGLLLLAVGHLTYIFSL